MQRWDDGGGALGGTPPPFCVLGAERAGLYHWKVRFCLPFVDRLVLRS